MFGGRPLHCRFDKEEFTCPDLIEGGGGCTSFCHTIIENVGVSWLWCSWGRDAEKKQLQESLTDGNDVQDISAEVEDFVKF